MVNFEFRFIDRRSDHGFEKNVNTIIKDFESVGSDGRIERYRRSKFARSGSNQANSGFSERERFPIQPYGFECDIKRR